MKWQAKTKLIAGSVLFVLGFIGFAVSFDIPEFSGFWRNGFNPESIPVALSILVMSAGTLVFLGGAKECVGIPAEDAEL